MGMYAWIITKDKIADTTAAAGTHTNAVGLTGPRRAPEDLLARLKAGEGQPFRMYDDDDELYYEGRLLGDAQSEDGFAPLDGFGTPNAGCTRIDYRNEKGAWETL